MTRPQNGAATVVLYTVLAASWVGCADDDGDGTGVQDGGFDSGFGGRAGGGRGGSGNNAGSSAGPSVAECVDKTMTATAGAVERECVSCVCERGPASAVACNAACWDLVTCYAAACANVDVNDMNAVAGCAFMHCEQFVAEITPATDVIKNIAVPCRDECIGKMTPADAGMDAGG